MAVTSADVRALYLNFLGRLPSAQEISERVSNPNAHTDAMKTELLNSEEAANRTGVIQNAYRHWLGREASDGEIELKLRATETQTSQQLVAGIRNSPEGLEFQNALSQYIDAYIPYDPGFQGLKNAVNGQEFHSQTHAGLFHWMTHGKNESRVLPSPVPKLTRNADGSLNIADSKWFSNHAYNQYRNIVNRFSGTQGGNYLTLINDTLNGLNDGLASAEFLSSGKNAVDAYYLQNKAPAPWDPQSLGVYPPDGRFDQTYYASQGVRPQALQTWNEKVNAPIQDLDFISRYGNTDPLLYLLQDYTNVGRHMGLRGAAPTAAEKVTEKERLTDTEKQLYRDQVLGISNGQLLLATPQYDAQGNLLNPAEVNTLLEKKFAEVLTATDIQKQKQFGALAQDVLKTSVDALVQAKQKEANLSFMKNLPGYNEILDINTTLTNSILGDSGLGGLLGITGQYQTAKTGFQKQIEDLTGVTSNTTVYNWQKWFDETLLERYKNYEYQVKEYTPEQISTYQAQAKQEIQAYNQKVAAGDTTAAKPVYLETAEKNNLSIDNINDFKQIMIKADQQSQMDFVSSFINGFIKPRFDQSKSMDEFISYLDVKEEEQNIFQAQSTINKLKQIAELRSNTFLGLMQQAETAEKSFDPTFYFDPLTNNTKQISLTKQQQYAQQKQVVSQDFENAKNGVKGPDGIDWNLEAYIYGYENTYKTDPSVFAKLHYQVKGSRGLVKDANGNPFILDPAEDILPYEELQKKIEAFGSEMALRKELYGDASFMQFVTPEEYADSLLASVDPAKNKEEWQKLLQQLGLDYTEDLQQVKNYLIESFRTEEAKTIRENIKYLNEAKEELTQENLGVSYIGRPADKTTSTTQKTALYEIFKGAGYGGTEDQFYDEFMPDVDRTEQQVISQAMGKEGLTLNQEDMKDPLSAFSKISSLFGEEGNIFDTEQTTATTTTTQTETEPSYFKLFGEDEEPLPQKSKSAESFLGEFTSMFKGFS